MIGLGSQVQIMHLEITNFIIYQLIYLKIQLYNDKYKTLNPIVRAYFIG